MGEEYAKSSAALALFRTLHSRLFTQSCIQAQIKENTKAPRHWPLCGEFTGTGEFPAQRASNAENGSIWWRHHESWQICVIPAIFVTGVMQLYLLLPQWQECPFHPHTVNIMPPDDTIYKLCINDYFLPLQWRHYGRDSVSNHQSPNCLLNRLFRRRSKKTSKLRVTGLCAGKSPGTGEFPAPMASYAENVSIWWRHHAKIVGYIHSSIPWHQRRLVEPPLKVGVV